jgi:hypothetical protein
MSTIEYNPTQKLPFTLKLHPGLDKKLALYALAGGAVLAAPGSLEGGPLYPDCIMGTTYSTSGPAVTCALDFDQSGISEFLITAAVNTLDPNEPKPRVRVSNTPLIGSARVWGEPGILEGPALPLSASQVLGDPDSENWIGSAYLLQYPKNDPAEGYWDNNLDNEDQFVGLRWDDGHLGWLQIGVHLDDTEDAELAEFKIHGYDESEHVSTPEPSTLSLFALGAAGILAMRRRKKKTDA